MPLEVERKQAGSNTRKMDPKNNQAGKLQKGAGYQKTGETDDKRKKSLKHATWNKGGANQELKKKRNEIILHTRTRQNRNNA